MLKLSLTALLATLVFSGCGDDGDDHNHVVDAAPAVIDAMPEPTFGFAADVTRATTLMTTAGDYVNDWGNFTDFAGFQDSNAPHGPTVRVYINDTAAANEATLAVGSVIIKQNFDAADVNMMSSITVMEKVAGFNPEAGDWFWAKFKPDGTTLMETPTMVKLAGKVTPCIGCHGDALGGDFVFLND